MVTRSLIIATRNRAEQLALGLASIEAQGYTDLDVVVVDDGSTDETAAVISNHANWLRVSRLPGSPQYRANPSYVLNRGHEAALGEIRLEQGGEVCHITRCADLLSDVCIPGLVALATVYNGDVLDYETLRTAVLTGGYAFGEDLEVGAPLETNGDRIAIPKVSIGDRGIQLYSGGLRPAPFLFLGAVHRDDRIAVGGYDERIAAGNDEDFANRLLARGVRFRFVAQAVAFHLRHSKT